MPKEGMWLLTWRGRKEETGAELLLQALEHWLEGVGGTDRHGDMEQDEGVSPSPPPLHHSHLPSFPSHCDPCDLSLPLAMTLGAVLTIFQGTPGRQKVQFLV